MFVRVNAVISVCSNIFLIILLYLFFSLRRFSCSEQYVSLLRSVDYMSWLSLRAAVRSTRPTNSIHTSPRAWWKFAYEHSVKDYRRRTLPWSWTFIRKRRDKRLQYLNLYRHVLLQETLTASDKKALATLEDELSVEDIIQYRRIARAKLPPAAAKTTAKSWFGFGSFFSSSSSSNSSSSNAATQVDNDEATRRFSELLEQEEEFQTAVASSYVGSRVKLEAGKIGVQLQEYNETSKKYFDVMTAALLSSQVGLDFRPAAAAVSFLLNVRNTDAKIANARGVLTQMMRCTAISPADTAETSEPVFSMHFETKPEKKTDEFTPDARLKMDLLPLELEAPLTSVARIVSFFEVPKDVNLHDLADMMDDAVASIKQQTKAGLEHVLENRQVGSKGTAGV